MFQHPSLRPHSNTSKIMASLRLEKLKHPPIRKKRNKRELIEVPVPAEIPDLHVSGSQAWAPLQQGAVRLVKRFKGTESLTVSSDF